MTSNTDAFQRPEHPAFRLFVTTALEAFAFLKDLGFGVASCADAANECAIRLTNETTGVEIRYDMPNIPTVSLARLNNAGQFTRDQYGLKFLICERCPEMDIEGDLSHSSPDTGFRDLLQAYAAIVRDYASDILEGNFSVFKELDRHVRMEMRRLQRKK